MKIMHWMIPRFHSVCYKNGFSSAYETIGMYLLS